MELKVAEVIVKCLEAEGVEYAFGISGSHYIAFFKALKKSSIRFISVKHESAAAFMALHYARLAQKPALLLGTAGPGALNLIGGIAEIFKSNLPCFVLTPIVPIALQGKNSFQEDTGLGNSYSVADLMKAVTKKTISCVHPDNAAHYVRDLFRNSLYGRKGPVHLLVPTNVFEQTVAFTEVPPRHYRISDRKTGDDESIAAIGAEIAKATHPILFIGQRAWYPAVAEELEHLSDVCAMPVVLSANAKGLFNEHSPNFGGVFDLYGHRSAEYLIKKSDCVVSFGEDFGEFATNKYEPDLFDGKLIQIDIDGYDIGRNYPAKLSTCGDMGSIATKLADFLAARKNAFWSDRSISDIFVKENSGMFTELDDRSSPLKPQFVLNELSKLLPDDAIVVGDIGANSYFSLRSLRVKAGGYSIAMANYTMGQGVAGALGAKLADPGKMVLSLCGDGTFLMNGMEVATSRQYDIPIIWIIFVNHKFGAVDWAQKLIYNDLDFCTDIFTPDFEKLAAAFDIGHYKIHDQADLPENFSTAFSAYREEKRSCLIEVHIDPLAMLPLKPRSVKFIQDICDTNKFETSPYLMKSFKQMLREKV